MKKILQSKKVKLSFILFSALLLMANSGEHPSSGTGGYTGGPNDSTCSASCHTGNPPINGTVSVDGLPATAMPGNTYPLTVTITSTSGSPVEAGFQLLALKSNLSNGGTFSIAAGETNTSVKMIGGKSYIGHKPSKNLSAGSASFNVNWTAPTGTGDVSLYLGAILANGNNSNSGDKFLATSVTTTLSSGGTPLSVSFSNVFDASCADSNDGGATVNATGGAGSYSYLWDSGETSPSATMLDAGSHSVTVSDAASSTIVGMVDIEAPTAVIGSIVFQADAECNGESNGQAELSSSGGTPGYTYSWSNGASGSSQSNLGAGFYTITVADVNDCEDIIEVTIEEPTAIDIDVANLTEPSCNGDNDGLVAVTANGGAGGYTYNWLDGVGIPSGSVLSDIPAGNYQVEVIDANGCINDITISLGQPNAISLNLTSTDVSCNGGNDGIGTVAASGGVGGFTYLWSNGGTGSTETGLPAGTYFVTATDANGCTNQSNVEILEPSTPVEVTAIVNQLANCGNSDGELSAFAVGGTSGYTFEWSTGLIGPILSNITSGIYTVTATDANGCTSTTSITLMDNDGVTLAANDVSNNDCFGEANGQATISAAGGDGNYTYNWSNGGTNAQETGLLAGTYTINVTDGNGCSGVIMIEITEPSSIQANVELNSLSCFGDTNGSIALNAEGGTGLLSYQWSNGSQEDALDNLSAGLYSVSITDELGCESIFDFNINQPDMIDVTFDSESPICFNGEDGSITTTVSGGIGNYEYIWNTGDITSSITGLMSGTYEVTITDDNNCESIASVVLEDPFQPIIEADGVAPTCATSADGMITINIIGGNGEYTYLWSNGDTTNIISNLATGSYDVVIVDENNCTYSSTIDLVGPPIIVIEVTTSNETSSGANDGSASASASEGVEPYEYLWSNGATTASIDNLAPGEYSVVVTDANGCTNTVTIFINPGDCAVTADILVTDITCAGVNDGMISISLNLADDPITYEWNNEDTTSTISNLAPGTYSATITDGKGCQIQVTDIILSDPAAIQITNIISMDESTTGAMDGSITLEATGGTGALSIIILDENGNEIVGAELDKLTTGIYIIKVIDENGCEFISEPIVVGLGTSVEDIDEVEISIYPNPALEEVIISANTSDINSVIGIDIHGKFMSLPFSKVGNEVNVDVKDLVNGIYIFQINTATGNTFRKIIINR